VVTDRIRDHDLPERQANYLLMHRGAAAPGLAAAAVGAAGASPVAGAAA
jgi:hypothetical protein